MDERNNALLVESIDSCILSIKRLIDWHQQRLDSSSEKAFKHPVETDLIDVLSSLLNLPLPDLGDDNQTIKRKRDEIEKQIAEKFSASDYLDGLEKESKSQEIRDLYKLLFKASATRQALLLDEKKITEET